MHIPLKDWPQHATAEKLFALLAQDGGEARFVGGCVRDAVLKRPIGDRDIACTHPPEKTMALLEAAGIRVIPTGLAHGTITALLDGIPFEITTLREDIETDGRHATVRFTADWKADAGRRDFTMNALSCGLDGEVQDYFSGVQDARGGVVRFIGDARQRIDEDALRILRFFRFCAHFSQPPYEQRSLAACTEKAAQIRPLSGERIQNEMFKLLTAKDAFPALSVMEKSGVLAEVGLSASTAVQAVLKRVDDPLLRLAALLRAMPSPQEATQQLSNRWKLSNSHKATLERLVAAPLADISTWDERSAKRHLRAWGKTAFLEHIRLAGAEQQKEYPLFLRLPEQWEIPQFPVNGTMLKAQGIHEGKQLGEALKQLEAAWEAADYQPTAEALLSRL